MKRTFADGAPLRLILFNIGALFSGTASARFLSVIATVLVTRAVGPEQYGSYASVFAVARIASVFFSLGLDGWLLQQGASADGEKNALPQRLTTSLVIQTGLGLIWLILLAVFDGMWGNHWFPPRLLLVGAIAIFFEELTYTGWTAFKVTLDNRMTFILMLAFQASQLFLFGALYASHVTDVYLYMIARDLVSAGGAAMALVVVWRRIGFMFVPQEVGRTLRATVPYALSMVLALVYGRADITIAGMRLGPASAGFYAPAVTLVMALSLIPSAIYGVMLPWTSRTYRVTPTKLPVIARNLFIWSALLGIFLALVLFFIADPLVLFLYGEQFAASSALLRILSGVIALRTLNFSVAAIIVAIGLQGRRVTAQAVAALFNVTANLLFIDVFGLPGVAIIYCASELILLLGYASIWYAFMRLQTFTSGDNAP